METLSEFVESRLIGCCGFGQVNRLEYVKFRRLSVLGLQDMLRSKLHRLEDGGSQKQMYQVARYAGCCVL